LLAQGLRGGAHGRAGRQTIVDEDHRLAPYVRERAIAAVGPLAPLELLQLLPGHSIDDLIRQVKLLHDLWIQHPHAARRERAHRILLVAG
jgi:hypothetical protein